MNCVLLVLASSVVGVDVGWQPIAGGGFEYIIQLEPDVHRALCAGEDMISDLPPEWRLGMRRCRITVGGATLPHMEDPPPELRSVAQSSASASGQSPSPNSGPGTALGWQPVAGRGIELIVRITPERATAMTGGGGQDAVFDLPVGIEEVRRYRITVGSQPVPHESDPLPPGRARSPAAPPQADAPASQQAATTPPSLESNPPAPKSNSAPSGRDSTPVKGDGQVQQAAYQAQSPPPAGSRNSSGNESAPREPSSPSDQATQRQPAAGTAEAELPWLPLTAALIALFVSLGANLYLVWTVVGLRQRCRDALRELNDFRFGVREEELLQAEPL